jgi:hypothetical protein
MAPTRTEPHQMAPNGTKWHQMAPNGTKKRRCSGVRGQLTPVKASSSWLKLAEIEFFSDFRSCPIRKLTLS